MRFRFVYGVIHAHFHEGILRKAGDAVGVFRDRRVMDVFEGDAFRERFHLAQSFCVGGIRGFDGAIAEEVHHVVHHVVRQVAMDHPGAGIFRVELDDTRLRYADENGVHGIPGGLWSAAAFGAGQDELIAVKVNGVVIHAHINDTETDAAAEAGDHGSDGGGGDAVEG